ncbi:MAG: ATP-dependent Clp protease ATP-binding subunit ClpA, partial [Desulfobacterales bacterium]|nr:ATP-dependent Clp protease ATP-binding subunit ClpA [Desulfobacterales bacterium]
IGFGNPNANAEFKGQKEIERLFSPEFRNRLDATITFSPLTQEIMLKIVDKFMIELNDQLLAKKVDLTLSAEARKYLAKKGHDSKFGARPLARVIQTEIKDKLSNEILFGELVKGGRVRVGVEEDHLTFDWSERGA